MKTAGCQQTLHGMRANKLHWRSTRFIRIISFMVVSQSSPADYRKADFSALPVLHPGNIAFASPLVGSWTESDLVTVMGPPETARVNATFGASLEPRHPAYLVAPSRLSSLVGAPEGCSIKIVDFGPAHLHGTKPEMRCPQAFQPPRSTFQSGVEQTGRYLELRLYSKHYYAIYFLFGSTDIADRSTR